MSLNIKNDHVHSLAREAARRTGRTQTSVIETALEQFVAALDVADGTAERELGRRRDRTARILAEVDGLLTDADREAIRQTMDDLYDDRGLPTW